MRISDWSSDVCSSDLGTASGQRLLHDRQDGAAPLRAGLAVAEDPLELPGEPTAADDGARLLDLRAGYRLQRRLPGAEGGVLGRSEEHTSELQSLMRISYAVFCLKKKQVTNNNTTP